MSDLANRMREAADTLEEANRRYKFGIGAPWSPRALRNEAGHVEAEDIEAAELVAYQDYDCSGAVVDIEGAP
jgi:hypothetical protein